MSSVLWVVKWDKKYNTTHQLKDYNFFTVNPLAQICISQNLARFWKFLKIPTLLEWPCCILNHSRLTNTISADKSLIVQINHQPDATIFQIIILTFIYSSTCFGRFPAHHQQLSDCNSRHWFYLRIVVTVVLCSWLGRPAWLRTQHDYHHDTKVKPEAATASSGAQWL
jgi:hypothetical protein